MMNRFVACLLLAAYVSVPAMAAKPVTPPPAPTVSGIKVYAAGQPVGYVLSLYQGAYGDYLTVLSDKGYLAEFMVNTGAFLTIAAEQGQPQALVYTGTYCNGDAYASINEGDLWKLRQGMVFRWGAQAYYTVRGPQLPFGVQYFSFRRIDGSCETLNGSYLQNAAPAFPNDVAVTGIPSEGLSLPIVFGIP